MPSLVIWGEKQSTARHWAERFLRGANRSTPKSDGVNHWEGGEGPRSSEELEGPVMQHRRQLRTSGRPGSPKAEFTSTAPCMARALCTLQVTKPSGRCFDIGMKEEKKKKKSNIREVRSLLKVSCCKCGEKH